MRVVKIIFEGIFSRNTFSLESVDLSNGESALLATHIAYESILTKSLQNETVDFFHFTFLIEVEGLLARLY